MIQYKTGNIFDSNTEALVNTVNTIGVMGKGVALQFKKHFPENFKLYEQACNKGEVAIGKMFVTSTNRMMSPKWIINFPTKKNWIHKSSYEFIESGLDDLIQVIKDLNINSISIPPLGAGQGGLNWQRVKQIIDSKLSGINGQVFVFEPSVSFFPIKTNQNTTVLLTKARALILALMDKYRKLGFDISLLEIQKLAYFLQKLGQKDLNLQFKKYYYGPYAHNLQHLLSTLENSYLIAEKPIFDSKPLDVVQLNNEKINEINSFIETNCSVEEKDRLKIIEEIIHGYESPFGLELLASVDWIMFENSHDTLTPEFLQHKISEWSKRKSDNFSLKHLTLAYNHLLLFKKSLQSIHID